MTTIDFPFPVWATAATSDPAGSLGRESNALEAHLLQCNGCRDRWFGFKRRAEAVNVFLSRRLFSLLAAFGAVLALAAVLL